MPVYTINVVNAEFQVENEHEASALEEAYRSAIKGALDIGVEEVSDGKPFFGAEVTISEDSRVVQRFLVSVGASPLQDPPLT